MQASLRKVTNLELIGDVENDENKEYWVLVKASPDGITTPANSQDDPIQKLGVSDGLARIVNDDFVKQFFANPRE